MGWKWWIRGALGAATASAVARTRNRVTSRGRVGAGDWVVCWGDGGGGVGENGVGGGVPAGAQELREVDDEGGGLLGGDRHFGAGGLDAAEDDASFAEQGKSDRVAAALGEEV